MKQILSIKTSLHAFFTLKCILESDTHTFQCNENEIYYMNTSPPILLHFQPIQQVQFQMISKLFGIERCINYLKLKLNMIKRHNENEKLWYSQNKNQFGKIICDFNNLQSQSFKSLLSCDYINQIDPIVHFFKRRKQNITKYEKLRIECDYIFKSYFNLVDYQFFQHSSDLKDIFIKLFSSTTRKINGGEVDDEIRDGEINLNSLDILNNYRVNLAQTQLYIMSSFGNIFVKNLQQTFFIYISDDDDDTEIGDDIYNKVKDIYDNADKTFEDLFNFICTTSEIIKI